ncbi:MAG: methyl-accepting chemotaxis protein [Magnetovibrio sp.]|nr:methyl-accepting chemotaxis protein [Magnetovibrio sp.]
MDQQLEPGLSDIDEDIEGALLQLENGEFIEVPDGTSRIGQMVRQVADKMMGFGGRSLERMVSVSVALNDAVIAAASMTRDIREVDHRTQSIAAATEEMVATVKDIANNSDAAAAEAEEAHQAASAGKSAAERSVTTMESIASAVEDAAAKVDSLQEAASQISDMVGEIDAIAKQTNLLALNATIEAARAGDAGKGFAVVASEVKNLANQTSHVTDEITSRIDNLRSEMNIIVSSMEDGAKAVAEGREVIQTTGNEMDTISVKITDVTMRMGEIANVLAQQTEASNEVSQGISVIAQMASKNVESIDVVVDAMDKADVGITANMDDVMSMQVPNSTILRAKSDHVIWKKKLAEMVIGRTTLNPDELASHTSCRLGKWVGGVTDPAILNHPAFAALERPHSLVHDHGIEAARKYQNHDLEGALAEIDLVDEPSKEVLRLLDELIASK